MTFQDDVGSPPGSPVGSAPRSPAGSRGGGGSGGSGSEVEGSDNEEEFDSEEEEDLVDRPRKKHKTSGFILEEAGRWWQFFLSLH